MPVTLLYLRAVIHPNQAHAVHSQDSIARSQLLTLGGRRVGNDGLHVNAAHSQRRFLHKDIQTESDHWGA